MKKIEYRLIDENSNVVLKPANRQKIVDWVQFEGSKKVVRPEPPQHDEYHYAKEKYVFDAEKDVINVGYEIVMLNNDDVLSIMRIKRNALLDNCSKTVERHNTQDISEKSLSNEQWIELKAYMKILRKIPKNYISGTDVLFPDIPDFLI